MSPTSAPPAPLFPRLVLLALQAMISPWIFWLFLMSSSALEPISVSLLGVAPTRSVETNVTQFALLPYALFALVVYGLTFALDYALVRAFRRDLALGDFVRARTSWFTLVPLAASGLNLYVWLDGMEGNVFGFLFALPMVGAGLLTLGIGAFEHLRLRRPSPSQP